MSDVRYFIDGQWRTLDEIQGSSGSDTLMGGTFTAPSSANIHRVDSRLVDAARQAAAPFAYDVEVTPHGGRNSRGRWGTPNHPGGWALDFTLVDPATGERLDNYRDPGTFRVYEQYAQAIKQVVDQQYPELSDVMRFGGYFGGRWGFDQMHVDITPSANQAMSQGSWEYGLGQDKFGNPIKLPARWRDVGSVGMLEGSEIPTVASAEPLPSRVASELDVEPSWPSAQEAVRMLAERGYTGPDAVAAFQQNELLNLRPSGSMDTETVAALMNPTAFLPTERPPVVAGSSGTDVLRSGRPDTLVGGIGAETPVPPDTGVSVAPNLRPGWARGVDASMASQKPPDLGLTPARPPSPKVSAGLGAVTPRSAPRGLPAPGARPAGLGASGQELPGSYRRLRVGDTGDDVREVQSRLVTAGFNPGPLDGAYGPRTAAAVLAFQRENPEAVGGKIDAIAGPWTQSALYDRTQNSALASLSDPGGVPRGSPSGLDVARTLGLPQPSPTGGAPFDPGGGTGRDSRPPGTVSAGLGVTRREITTPSMEVKPWAGGANSALTDLRATRIIAGEPDIKAGTTIMSPPEGSREPAPLSPVSVISGMGGTGSSGLGLAGPGGPGVPESWSSDQDDDDTVSGYNESFSTTGWL